MTIFFCVCNFLMGTATALAMTAFISAFIITRVKYQMQHPVVYGVKTVKFATLFDRTDRVTTLFAEVNLFVDPIVPTNHQTWELHGCQFDIAPKATEPQKRLNRNW